MAMSKKAGSNAAATSPRRQKTPMIGSLLRLPHEVVVARMLAALNDDGFDISSTELGVFLYPGPEGRRPSELARQCNTTPQGKNYGFTEPEAPGQRHG